MIFSQRNQFLNSLLVLTLFFSSLFFSVSASYLHAKGSKLYNDKEEIVRLTGVNWFGFETSNFGPHGLWARDYHGVLLQIKSLGFNCIRIPFCDAMLKDGAEVNSINFFGIDPHYPRDKELLNKELQGLTPLQMMDEIIRYASKLGLVIILDNHSREPDGYMNEKVWYTETTSEQQWIDNWVMLAERYKNNPAVVAFDLENEPHGKLTDGGSTWGSGNATTDWNTAAQKCGNAILAVNPDVLIIIEGVEQYESTGYWWGGNLRGIKKNPIVLSKPDKLVYSAHEYGPEVFQQPWFEDPDFPNNLEGIWDDAFGFVVKDNTAPLFIGEFGIKEMSSYQGRSGKWFTTFLKYLADNLCSWTFWCFNPNSGDTGGLLSYDWLTVEQWKVDAVKPWCAPLIGTVDVKHPVQKEKQKELFFSISNKRVICKGNTSGKLQIINLNGRILKSTSGQSLSLHLSKAGTYIIIYSKDSKLIKQQIVTVE